MGVRRVLKGSSYCSEESVFWVLEVGLLEEAMFTHKVLRRKWKGFEKDANWNQLDYRESERV